MLAGLFLAGQTLNALGGLMSARGAKKAGDYNAAVLERNARMARRAAALDAQRIEINNRLVEGATVNATASQGTTMSGSALDVLAFNANMGELDRLSRLYQGEVEAAGFQASANVQRMNGRNAIRSTIFSTIGSGISGYTTGRQLGFFGSPGQSNTQALRVTRVGTI